MKMKNMQNILLVLITVLFLTSSGFGYTKFTAINRINDEISTASSAFDPTHKCVDRGLELYCFRVTSTKKTCYTLPDNKGGKRCLVEPLWEEIIEEKPFVDYCNDIHDRCPDEIKEECLTGDYCPATTCPSSIICPVPVPCIQTCKGCGSGGGSSCPTTCPPIINCDNINCIAYVDNDEGGVTKWFCDKCGSDASCVEDGTLEMPWG